MMNYNRLREWVAEQEHIQWISWSKALASKMEGWTIDDWSKRTIPEHIADQVVRWKLSWKPYKELSEEVKECDREWADKILDNLPFKCPVYQCGGIMVAKERPYPKGMNDDDFPPDLVCLNCNAVYHFDRFKPKQSTLK